MTLEIVDRTGSQRPLRRRSLLRSGGHLALALCGLALADSLRAASAAGATDAPEAFIRKVSDQVLGILKDPATADDAKLKSLKKLLDQATDLDLLAKLVLGKYWRTASDGERAEYVAVFRELVMKAMADRLHDYGGETMNVVGSQSINDRDAIVATNIVRPSGDPPIRVDWRVRTQGGQQAIIDVVAEGVSLVVTQRSEVGDLVAKEGMAGLIRSMRQRLEGQSS